MQSDTRSETASHGAGSRPSSEESLSPARSSRASSQFAEPEPAEPVEDAGHDELVVENAPICAVPEVRPPSPVTVPADDDSWGDFLMRNRKDKKKKSKAPIWD